MSGEGNEYQAFIANISGGTGGVGGIGGVMGGGGGVGQGPTVNLDIKTVGTLTNNFGAIYIIHVGEFTEAVVPGNSEFPCRAPLEPEVTNREEEVVPENSAYCRCAPLEPKVTNRAGSHNSVHPRHRALDSRMRRTIKAKAIWQNQLEPKMIHMLRESSTTVDFRETHREVYDIVLLVGTSSTSGHGDGSWDLYSQVSAFFAEHAARIYSATQDDDALVLDYYDSEWDLFSRSMQPINAVFM
ncbi:hypothetical protein B0H14DRAFT_3898638 [Mycena olivaceomarginata]|nr:hypothetical protein B0H14DRAFT_3898638 [Mycena olivaceomarginata]